MKKIIPISLLLAVTFIMVGPRPPAFRPSEIQFDSIPKIAAELESHVEEIESGLMIKNDNQARIFWFNDSLKSRTPYCLLYLHGFSATWKEGDPVHHQFASKYGMNAYLPRLAGHGVDTSEVFATLTARDYYASAVDALEIANQLGEKVIIMSTSTGGTLSLLLAHYFPEKVHSLIMYSPNLDFYGGPTWVFTLPWGLQVARLVNGSPYYEFETKSQDEENYWSSRYRLEGIQSLRQVVDAAADEKLLAEIEVPVFIGYYYKDEANQDKIVKVEAIEQMAELIGTSKDSIHIIAFPNVGHHVIASPIKSKDVKSVHKATFNFAEQILGL